MNETPKPGDIVWNELGTPNTQKAKDFYGKVFGWEFSDTPVGDMTYTLITTNGKQCGGMWAIPKDQQSDIPPHWMSYILVENVDKSLEEIVNHGGSILKPADNAGDMGRFAIIKDPTGAYIALWETLRK